MNFNPQEEVMMMERVLLKTIKFDLQIEHPYGILIKYLKYFKGKYLNRNILLLRIFICGVVLSIYLSEIDVLNTHVSIKLELLMKSFILDVSTVGLVSCDLLVISWEQWKSSCLAKYPLFYTH